MKAVHDHPRYYYTGAYSVTCTVRQMADEYTSSDVDTDRQPTTSDGLPWAQIDYEDHDSPVGSARDSDVPDAGDLSMAQTRVGSAADRQRVAADVPSDADGEPIDSAWWDWIAELNAGRGDKHRDEYVRRESARRDIEIICDQLGCTDYQQSRAVHLFESVPIKETVLPSGPIEVALIAIVSVVIDEERTRRARAAPSAMRGSVLGDEAFHELCDAYDVARTRVRDARRNLTRCEHYESPNA